MARIVPVPYVNNRWNYTQWVSKLLYSQPNWIHMYTATKNTPGSIPHIPHNQAGRRDRQTPTTGSTNKKKARDSPVHTRTDPGTPPTSPDPGTPRLFFYDTGVPTTEIVPSNTHIPTATQHPIVPILSTPVGPGHPQTHPLGDPHKKGPRDSPVHTRLDPGTPTGSPDPGNPRLFF
jgi:hypothetical protein